MAAWLRRILCQRGQWTRQRRLFCLEGDPKALSSRARSTAQAPAPGREHGHFVRVRINTSKTTATSETGGQALRTQCINGSFRDHSPLRNQGVKHCVRNAKKRAGSGTTDHPETAARGKQPLRNRCPLRNQGANHFGGSKDYAASSASALQEELDRGPLTTPKPPIAPPLAPPTPAENGGPSETAVRSDMGAPLAATVQHLRLRNHAVFTPFLPRFYPTFTPLRVKCRVSTPFLPRFYPVAPVSFYPYG